MATRLELGGEWDMERVAVLQQLFSDKLSAQEAAQRLATMNLEKDVDTGIGRTWRVILITARQKPEHQAKLVDLLVKTCELPPERNERNEITVDWSKLSGLGMELNYEWNGLNISEEYTEAERQKLIQAFINSNFFTARLMQTGKPRFNYSLFALWTMRQALECPSPRDNEPWEATLPAAAAWITTIGRQMYQWDEEFEQGRTKGRPGMGGPLWSGKHGFCRERWSLWRSRFEALASLTDLSEGTRNVVAEAAIRMREIEMI